MNAGRVSRNDERVPSGRLLIAAATTAAIDSPFLDAQGRRLENFTRIETFGNNPNNGNNDVRWLKVNVDARTREVFAFQPQSVPGNRVAVPAP